MSQTHVRLNLSLKVTATSWNYNIVIRSALFSFNPVLLYAMRWFRILCLLLLKTPNGLFKVPRGTRQEGYYLAIAHKACGDV